MFRILAAFPGKLNFKEIQRYFAALPLRFNCHITIHVHGFIIYIKIYFHILGEKNEGRNII